MTDIYRGLEEAPRILDPVRPRPNPSRSRSPAALPDLEVPELRAKAEPKVEVVLSRSARDTIVDDLNRSTRMDGLEAGGFLHGHPTRSWEKRIDVLDATRTEAAERSSDWLRLDTEPWKRREQAYAAEEFDGRLVGFWHSHPATRDGTPSETDLASLLGVLRWHEQHGRSAAYSVGLIFADDGDWTKPALHGWVVYRNPRGFPVCEPAAVRDHR